MTHQEDSLEKIAEAAAKAAVRETFLHMGMSLSDDGDFLESQKDLAWLRSQRLLTESVSSWIRMGIITTVCTAFFGLLWMGFKLVVHQ